jgi:formimidoylglutamate deiminase
MAAESTPPVLWAPLAWLPGGWRTNVLLRAGADGRWLDVTADVAAAARGRSACCGAAPARRRRRAQPRVPARLRRPRRAARRRSDDFWSWRERMYGVALRVTPEQLRAVAAQLYVELLRGGYTHVCEFHYLRRDRDGSDYADPLAMSWALADAAADAGIGLTILPVLYERAGFAADGPARRTAPVSLFAGGDRRRGGSAFAPPRGLSSTRAWRSTRCAARARRPSRR